MSTLASSTSTVAPAEQMRQMLAGHVVAQCLHAMAHLGIPDLIAKGTGAINEIAAATGTHAPSLHRMLRTMASMGVLTEATDGEFGLTPLGATLCSDGSDSVRDQALFETSPSIWASWAHLLDSLRSGRPSFESVNRRPLYNYLAEHAELATIFNRFMTAQSKAQNVAITDSYDFSWANTVIDVGGGHGATLAAVLMHYPTLKGILVDLPEVVRGLQIAAALLAETS